MSLRVQRFEVRNFKAFRGLELDLQGRHLLVYGANGSGKSSLYWALFTFLQSARKATPEVAKYFDPGDPQNLLNLHEQAAESPTPGEIALVLRDQATNADSTYRISATAHETAQQPIILKGDLASDFITYRFFFGFGHFRNSERFDVWPIFEREVLPFCVSTGGTSPLEAWQRICGGNPNPARLAGSLGAKTYKTFHLNTTAFATILSGIVDPISTAAQAFYDTHFSQADQAKVTLKLAVTTPPSSVGNGRSDFQFTRPVLEFGIQIDGQKVHRPQVHLNEAKLTQLALSVRLAASLVNLHESDLKLLVLDDLLVSLDMSNRMKVVEILLSDTFEGYQKVILTHDYGLFREFRRAVGSNHPDWNFVRLDGDARTIINAKSEKDEIQKAEDYLFGHNLDEAALCLRKACEDTARRFLDHAVVPGKEFVSLSSSLRVARKKILSELQSQLYEQVIEQTPEAHRHLLIAPDDDDIENNPALDEPSKRTLRTNRRRLRNVVGVEHVERLRQIKLIDDILKCTDRVLNPSAHAGTPPLYEGEVTKAVALVRQLQTSLV